MAAARCMLKAKKLPGMFWGEAVNCAVYILNRTYSKGTGSKTPYELWTGSKPAVKHLKTFGCIAHVKDTRPHLKKLDDRSRPMIFVGYEPGSVAYRCYDPVTKHVHISRDVIFDEDAMWDWQGEKQTEIEYDFRMEDGTEDYPAIERRTERVYVPEQASEHNAGVDADGGPISEAEEISVLPTS
jgi:hypothetical protein